MPAIQDQSLLRSSLRGARPRRRQSLSRRYPPTAVLLTGGPALSSPCAIIGGNDRLLHCSLHGSPFFFLQETKVLELPFLHQLQNLYALRIVLSRGNCLFNSILLHVMQ
jgi:hypothetical protein